MVFYCHLSNKFFLSCNKKSIFALLHKIIIKTMNKTISTNDLYSLEAEVELLGMLIQDNNRIESVDYVLPEYFYLTVHGEIFTTIKYLINKKHPADVLSVASQLANSDDFVQVGGKEYLIKMQQTLSYSTIRGRGELVYSLWLKRKLVNVGQEIVEDGNKSTFLEVQKAVSLAESKIYNLSMQNERGGIINFDGLSDGILKRFDEARKNDRPITGVSCGFSDLDKLLGGFKKSDLVILAARPSMGKTAFAVNIAYNIAKQKLNEGKGGGVALFSLEMSAEQIATRTIAIHADQNSRILDTGRYMEEKKKGMSVSDYDFNIIRDSVLEIKDLPLFIDDSAAISISTLYSRVRRLKRKHNIDMVMVDYLQLVRGTSSGSNINRTLEIAEVTQGLKSIAKELGIPVIALSQLSRGVESREDKKPQLSDLRESGAIEQDADIVMFLYREAYYMERTEPDRAEHSPPVRQPQETQEEFSKRLAKWGENKVKHGEWFAKYQGIQNLAEVIIAKNRNGPIGSINLSFEKEKTKFYDRQQISRNYIEADKPVLSNPKRIIDDETAAQLQKNAPQFGGDIAEDDSPF